MRQLNLCFGDKYKYKYSQLHIQIHAGNYKYKYVLTITNTNTNTRQQNTNTSVDKYKYQSQPTDLRSCDSSTSALHTIFSSPSFPSREKLPLGPCSLKLLPRWHEGHFGLFHFYLSAETARSELDRGHGSSDSIPLSGKALTGSMLSRASAMVDILCLPVLTFTFFSDLQEWNMLPHNLTRCVFIGQ